MVVVDVLGIVVHVLVVRVVVALDIAVIDVVGIVVELTGISDQ